MLTIFDPNVNGVKGTVAEIAPLAKKYGLGGISVPGALLENPAEAMEAAKLVQDLGLSWSLLPTPADFYTETLSEEAFDAAIEKFKRTAALGAEMGVRFCYNHVWNGSNLRKEDAQFEWVLGRIRRVFEVADANGIRYGMEFLGPVPLQKSFRYPFFNSLSGILALADEVSPRCGFLFDTYHWYCGSNQRIDEAYLASRHVDRMVGFHVNDGVIGRTREEQEDMERRMPLSTGIINAALPYRLFSQAGYDGPMFNESMRPWSENREGRTLEETVAAVAGNYEKLRAAAGV